MPLPPSTHAWFTLLLSAFALSTAQADVIVSPSPPILPTDLDSADLEVTYSTGFDGLIWQNATTPITFQIKNTSPEFFSGSIEIEVGSYNAKLHRLPIEIGQNSLRRFSLGIQFPSYVDDVHYRIIRDGKTLWRRSLNNINSSAFSKTASPLAFERPPPILAISTDHIKAKPEDTAPGFTPGRALLRIAPWELPDHDQILSPVGGVFFAQNTDFRTLTGARINALAHYLAHGGSIFVPNSAGTWMQKLVAELPYDTAINPDKPTPVGLGLLVPYTPDQSSPPWGRKDLLDIASNRPAPNYAGHFQSQRYYGYSRNRGPRSQTSIVAVSLFVVAYLIAAGPLLFFFRKAKRKNIIRLLVILIAAASFLSIALGVYLRSSPGDLGWVSLTRVAEGGATQTAVLFLSSAGGREHEIGLGVPDATIDTSDIFTGRYFNPSNFRHSDQYFGMVYQNSITAPIATGSTVATLPPLGQRRIHARAPIAGVKPLELEAEPIIEDRRKTTVTLTATIRNPNPFPILNPTIAYATQNYIYSTPLPSVLPAGGKISGTFRLGQRTDPDSFQRNSLQSFAPPAPREPRPILAPWLPHIHLDQGKNRLTFLGSLAKSPAFQASGDFVDSQNDHYLTQTFSLPQQ